jgi:hypothetical protein
VLTPVSSGSIPRASAPAVRRRAARSLAWSRAGVAHRVEIVPGTGHGFALVPAVWTDLLAFLRRNL